MIQNQNALKLFDLFMQTIEVTIPEIEAMRLAHYLTIGSECSTSIASHLEKLYVLFFFFLFFTFIETDLITSRSSEQG